MNVFKILRSVVAGRRPTTDVKQAGSLYVNYADKQLGVLDTAGSPVDLLPITFYSELADYKSGALVVRGAYIFRSRGVVPAGVWDRSQWINLSGYGT